MAQVRDTGMEHSAQRYVFPAGVIVLTGWRSDEPAARITRTNTINRTTDEITLTELNEELKCT